MLDYSCSKFFGEAVSPPPSPVARADGFLITTSSGERNIHYLPSPGYPKRVRVVIKSKGYQSNLIRGVVIMLKILQTSNDGFSLGFGSKVNGNVKDL